MITKIEIEDQIINLNMEHNNIPNIFDIDSISLIIGNNGSGKTTLLRKILTKFSPKSEIDKYSCVISLDYEKQLDYSEMRNKWGAVFYSPIPYGHRLHSSKNIIDASPRWGKPISAFDLQSHGEILESFGISPKVYASKTIDIRKVCRILVETLIVQSFPHIENSEIAALAPRLLRFLEDTHRPKQTMGLESYSSFDSEQESIEEREKEKLERKLIDLAAAKLYQHILKALGNKETTYCFFATLDHHMTNSKKESDLIRELTHIKLNKNHNQDVNYVSRETRKALKDFDQMLELFSCRPHSIKLGSKGVAEIELDPYEETSPIKKLEIEHLFDVGLQNMSSGQLAVIAQLILISEAITSYSARGIKHILLLLDEGDAFLHLEWQRKYISQLNKMLGKLKHSNNITSLQLIIATHSPLLATDIPKQFIFRMESSGEASAPSAFAAPLHSLVNQSFGAKTIGEFASEKIQSTIGRIRNGTDTDLDHFIANSVDNPIIKAEILRISKLEGRQT